MAQRRHRHLPRRPLSNAERIAIMEHHRRLEGTGLGFAVSILGGLTAAIVASAAHIVPLALFSGTTTLVLLYLYWRRNVSLESDEDALEHGIPMQPVQ